MPIRRLRTAVGRYGAVGALRQGARVVRSYPARRARARRSRAFDEQYGVDTAAIVRLHDLDISSDNVELGVRYQPSGMDGVRAALEALPIDHGDYVFVDLGSGKGRVLLLASEYPFRRLVGVEFAPELNEIAHRNLECFPADRKRCSDVEIVTADVVDYELPSGSLVLYLYNPFAEPVLRRVLDGLRESLDRDPRRILVILTGAPHLEPVLLEAGLARLDLPRAGSTNAFFAADGPLSPPAPAGAAET